VKRDPRLHGLTSDHHHALVLALRIKEAAGRRQIDAARVGDVRRDYDSDLSPHFAVEEEELLPALATCGRQDLVDRTLREHEALRVHLQAAEAGDVGRLEAFGALLEAHVRFEEGELFPACEALVGDEVLGRVAHLAPKEKPREPYATLAREHRLIERALEILVRICDDSRLRRRLDAGDARQVIHFLREFADRTHHLKEERILFPAIESASFFPGCGLIDEHQLGRRRVKGMDEAVELASQGDAEAGRAFRRQAWSFINLLREHIAKEDDCLANVVHRSFSREEGERLTREFEDLERRELGDGVFERFAAIVETMEAKYRESPRG
jgi:hemerythrin-like domain-containing protein